MASATTRWVWGGAPAGGNGTQSNPYQTITQGVNAASSGDTVEVEYGTYPEEVRAKSGVNIMADPGNRVIVSGMYSLSPSAGTTWATYTGQTGTDPGNVYYTSSAVPFKVRDLYGGSFSKQQIARYPYAGTPWATVSSYNSSNDTITLSAPLGMTLSTPMSAFVFIFQKTPNLYQPYLITSMSSNGQTITINPNGNGFASSINAGDQLIVCNHPQLIHSFQDWAYQDNGNSTTTLYWFPGDSNNLTYGQANYREFGIFATGVSNVVLSGLEVVGGTTAGISVSSSSGVTVQNCVAHDNGFGDTYGGPGIASRGCTNTTIQDCDVYSNDTGVTSQSDTGFILNQTEIAYNEQDGIDVSGLDGAETSPTIENCYIHNHTALSHPDNLQFYDGVTNATIENNFLDISGQSIQSQTLNGVTANNNIFMCSQGNGVILAGGQSINWSLNNNTFAMECINATCANPAATSGTDGQYSVLNSIFYDTMLGYSGQTASNYNLFWNNAFPIGNVAPPTYSTYEKFYGDPTGNELSLPAVTSQLGFEANSTPGNPMFNNAPYMYAQVQKAVMSSTTTQITVDAPADTNLTGYFNQNDVLELDGDGVPRQINSVSYSPTGGQATITFSPALPHTPIRTLEAWDWPAGTTNLALDLTLAANSPALTGSSTGGQRGSTINTLQYEAGSFDGTGNRDIPAVPQNTFFGAYEVYPYNGIVP